MPDVVNVAVIGCGIFGAEIALAAKECGFSVQVYEAKTDILSGASANNQNRLHLGFHYPRDLETGRQSIRGFGAFKEKYAECIQEGFPNAYFIANENSQTPPSVYLEFCRQLGARYEPISARDFQVKVRGADIGILCDEVVYDCKILRDVVWNNLRRAGIDVALGERVTRIARIGGRYRIESTHRAPLVADAVINATYGDINRLTAQLGHEVTEKQYEYTAVPVIAVEIPKVGVTIMDGEFMTVLPYGKSNNFLLYNVKHTVIAADVGPQMNPAWAVPDSAPFAQVDKQSFFRKMIALCAEYVPALERAQLAGFLEGPRMVLARKEGSDARPSIIDAHDGTYFTVLSGKIDHCMWVADEVCDALKGKIDL